MRKFTRMIVMFSKTRKIKMKKSWNKRRRMLKNLFTKNFCRSRLKVTRNLIPSRRRDIAISRKEGDITSRRCSYRIMIGWKESKLQMKKPM